MRGLERIPLHDHSDRNAGGKIDANASRTVVTTGGGTVGEHAIDSPVHTAASDITTLDATTSAHGLLPKLSGSSADALLGDGTWGTLGHGVTLVGEVTADGSPVTISSGTSYRAFPGACWLDNPIATTHVAGDRFLVVYRDGTGHLTAGKIVGKIATVTDASTWTFSLGTQFDIEDVANDLRCEDAVSVVDIDGAGDYRVVIVAREYNGSINLSSHILVSAVAPGSVTSGASWTRYEVTNTTGTTQSATSGRMLRLSAGTYIIGAQWVSSGTSLSGVLISSTATDWTSPTAVTIATGYNECDIEEMPDGTLIAHLRNAAQTFHYESQSTDSGSTWSSAVQLYAAGGYPAWRRLTSGIGLAVHRNGVDILDAAWRQTQSATLDTGWGSETILDSTGTNNQYATILQLDDTHALVVYAVEMSSSDADIYSQVFTDSSVIGGANVLVSSTDTESGFLLDKVVAGAGITLIQENAGSFERLEVAANGGATTTDAGGYFSTSTVEGNLQEIGADLALIASGAFAHSEIAVLGDAGPTPLTTDDSTDYLYVFPAS